MPSRTVGQYRILEEVGAGGMGTVFRAEDTRLGRQVALKYLSATSLPDDQTLKRFRQEARAASALNHPNICTIHEIGDDDGAPFIVMELLEGQSLRQRLIDGALPPHELFDVAAQIADALDAAHEAGVIHRDIKPANIFITNRGIAKLLDFGLAKIAPSPKALAGNAPPRTTGPLTEPQAIIGTVPYMSPEQVRGQSLDARTDLFSFGAVLYEMATGRNAFGGDTTFLVLEAVLTHAPEAPARVNPDCPPELDSLIGKALEKDRDLRYQSAREMLVDLKRLRGDSAPTYSGPRPVGRPKAARWAAAVGAVVALAAAGWWYAVGSPAGQPVQIELGAIQRVTTLPGHESTPALSPDGQMVAFVWQETDNTDIWVKAISGGAPINVTNHPADDDDPDWSPDGSTIVFRSGRRAGGLFTVPALGGDATRLTEFGFHPRWSPNGGQVLFQLRQGTSIPNEVYVVDYPTGQPRKLLAWEAGQDPYESAEWSPNGQRLVSHSGSYVAGAGLFVSPSDGTAGGFFLEWAGQNVRGENPVWAADGRALLMESAAGLRYVPLDGDGRAVGPTMRLSTSSDTLGDVSADGTTVAYVGRRSAQTDIWKVRLDRETGLPVGAPVRVIDSSAADLSPVPLPDNRHFLFVSERDGGRFLYVADLDGNGIKLIDRSRNWGNVVDVQADGRVIVLFYREPTQEGRFSASVLPFDPDTREALGPAREFVAGEVLGNLSPDGRYLLRTPTSQPHGLLAFENPVSENPLPIEFALDADFRTRYPNTTWSFFSPDGNWIAFGAYEERHKPAIFVLRVGATTPQLVWEGSGFPKWAADSQRIYVFSERPDDTFDTLGAIDIDTESGAPLSGFQRLYLEPGPGELVALDHRSTPDGRWLFFVFTEEEGDVYVADLIVK